MEKAESNKIKKYYLAKNGEKLGPFSIRELQNIDIDKESLIWYNGIENWVKIQEIEELSQVFNQIPPPIPKSKNDLSVNIVPPIDITLVKNRRCTNERKRKIVKKILAEIVFIILFFCVSAISGLILYKIYSETNKPTLVSDANQEMFNMEFEKREEENQSQTGIGDIMYKYLGLYKFDNEIISGSQLYEINKIRNIILIAKSKEYGWYCFYILFGLLIVIRYVIKFTKWLNPIDPDDIKNENK